MRFLFVIKSFAVIGGVERVMSDKMNYLASQNHSIELITYEQGNHPHAFDLHPSIKYKDIDCRFFTLMKLPLLKRVVKSIRMKKKFSKKIKEVIEDFKPDIIISPTYPLIAIKGLSSNKGSARLFFESHMTYIELFKSFSKSRSLIGKAIAKIYDWRAIKIFCQCDYMVVLTHGDYHFWSKYIPNVKLIPNSLTYYPSIINDIEKEPCRIISIGRLTKIKRFDRLIDSFTLISKSHPNWHIEVFGEGSDKESLNKRIIESDLEHKITIHPATKDIYKEIMKSQFLVMSSESEGFSLILIEAMSCGVPCISFNCPFGPGEIIEHNKNGLLANNGDIKDLAEKMNYLIENPNIINEMSEYARLSSAKYKKERILGLWEQLYTGNSHV